VVLDEVTREYLEQRFGPNPPEFHAAASVPLVSSGKTLGALFVTHRSHRRFSAQDIELLTSIGLQIGVAMENTQLSDQLQKAAAVDERQRLARELHDAVTQTLFSASLIAEVLPRIMERDPEEGRRRLEELRQLARGALAEMRTLLMELRPAALVEASLGDLLRQLTEAFGGRARLPISLSVVGDPSSLPPDVKIAFYRVAQEALNNIARHSGATQAGISLLVTPEEVELAVRDNGVGFDPKTIASDHLGLGIMAERAEAIGAGLSIHTQTGQGTEVTITWCPDPTTGPPDALSEPESTLQI
jgi:signal transduction histidine kinase